jgi:hypothetical protein
MCRFGTKLAGEMAQFATTSFRTIASYRRNSFMQNTNILRRRIVRACCVALVAAPRPPTLPQQGHHHGRGLPAGGSTDLVGRLVADGLAKHLGQPVVVENLGGAGGAIGAQKVAKALPTATPSWWAPTTSWPLPGSSTRP